MRLIEQLLESSSKAVKKSKFKKSFNARLSWWERFLQDIPTWAVVLLVAVPFSVAGTFLPGLNDDEENECRGWTPDTDCAIQLIAAAFDSIETIAILSAAAVYLKESPDRKDKKHYEAWQVVEKAEGRETSYSRYKALQDLNDDDVSLEGLDAPGADLCRIRLSRAKLKGANLIGSDLSMADLSEANLVDVKLKAANLEAVNLQDARLNVAKLPTANLERANLRGANLEGADLGRANLMGADLVNANLEGANLEGANLAKARLTNAILTGANLSSANLSDAGLENTSLEQVNLEGANLKKIKWSPETTVWPNMDDLKKAQNIPQKLQAKIGLIPSSIFYEEES
ncbi:MAG: pentapeptide repeat-containing protein [Cyanobacteria bacterium P01_H01_bin.105]